MKLTLTAHGQTYSAELAWDSSFSDILQALLGLGVAATYSHRGMLLSMQEFAEEELNACYPSEEVEKTENEENY